MGNKASRGDKRLSKTERIKAEIQAKADAAFEKERTKHEAKFQDSSEFTQGAVTVKNEEVRLASLSKVTNFSIQVLKMLEELFNRISESKNADLLIDRDELAAAMELDTRSLLAQTIFRLFDATQSNSINFRTYVHTS